MIRSSTRTGVYSPWGAPVTWSVVLAGMKPSLAASRRGAWRRLRPYWPATADWPVMVIWVVKAQPGGVAGIGAGGGGGGGRAGDGAGSGPTGAGPAPAATASVPARTGG